MFVIKSNQRGYILLESLIGLLILSSVILTLIQLIPMMVEVRVTLDIERTIYNTLYEIYDQQKFYSKTYPNVLIFSLPIPYTVISYEDSLCATYIGRDQNEKTICL